MQLHDDYLICLLFILFMFVVTIVLFNLLNALAISDTQQILDEGEMADLLLKVEILHDYEASIYRNNCLVWLKEMILGKMSVFPNLSGGKIMINLCDQTIIWKGLRCDLESGRFSNFCSKMDVKIVKKLQNIINDSNERMEFEKREAELEACIKSMEKLLVDNSKKIDLVDQKIEKIADKFVYLSQK